MTQSGCFIAYTIDPAAGNLTQASCSPPGANSALAIPAPGNFAYNVTGDPLPPSKWYVFSVNQNDGSLTQIQSYNSTIGAGTLFTDPQGRALYELVGPQDLSSCGSAVIWQIDPDSGVLTNLNTSFSPLCEPFAVAFNPGDTFAYVSSGVGENHSQNGIYVGAADATTGNLTSISGSPFASGVGVDFGAVEPSQGKFLLEQGAAPLARCSSKRLKPVRGRCPRSPGSRPRCHRTLCSSIRC